MQTKSCTPRVKWEQLSVPPPPSSFQPRYGHTAIAVESDSIFISGGLTQHQRRLSDLWRFEYLTNTWTSLNTAPLRNNHPATHRQAAVLGPWGLLTYGGLKQKSGTPLTEGRDLSIQHLFQDEQLQLAVPLSGNNNNNNNSSVVGPHGRYLSSIALMESSDIINKLYNNIEGPFLLMFGGDRGHSINAYPNNYGFMPNSFLDDMWILSPSGNNNFIDRSDYCIGRLERDSTQYQIWNNTCGWEESFGGEPDECELGEILIMAWCKERYQSLHMY
mmetsp:Transcript_13806/g.28107  ORF Transcript_13806/g.28107 Transcript_13806/m.28107 type:complete len:274 (+) Transcript_13806:2084-2905(+)